jgi:hypothetical protein
MDKDIKMLMISYYPYFLYFQSIPKFSVTNMSIVTRLPPQLPFQLISFFDAMQNYCRDEVCVHQRTKEPASWHDMTATGIIPQAGLVNSQVLLREGYLGPVDCGC